MRIQSIFYEGSKTWTLKPLVQGYGEECSKGSGRSGSSRVVKGKSSGRRSSSMDKKEHEYRSYKN
jgi:hypothetical protein